MDDYIMIGAIELASSPRARSAQEERIAFARYVEKNPEEALLHGNGVGYLLKNPLARPSLIPNRTFFKPQAPPSTIEARTALPTAPLFLTLGLGLVVVKAQG